MFVSAFLPTPPLKEYLLNNAAKYSSEADLAWAQSSSGIYSAIPSQSF